MRTDFYVPEQSNHWLSAELSVAVLVFVALLVLCALIAIRILRRMRERSALWAAWTDRQVAAGPPSAPDPTVARHAAQGFAAHHGNAGRHFADESPTREIRFDGSWSA